MTDNNLGYACTSSVAASSMALDVLPYAELPVQQWRAATGRRQLSQRLDELLQSVDVAAELGCTDSDSPVQLRLDSPEHNFAKLVRNIENVSPQSQDSLSSQSQSQIQSQSQSHIQSPSQIQSEPFILNSDGCTTGQRELLRQLSSLCDDVLARPRGASVDELTLRAELLHALSLQLGKIKSADERLFARLSADGLAALVEHLTGDVAHGATRRSDAAVRRPLRDWDVFVGLRAAAAVLHVLTVADLPKTVFADETIDATIDFVKSMLLFYVYPRCDAECTTRADPIVETSPLQDCAASSTQRGKASPPLSAKASGVLSVRRAVPILCELVKHLAQLFRVRAFTDSQVLTVVGFCFPALVLDNVDVSLQHTVVELIYTIFAQHPRLRLALLGDFVEALLRLFAKSGRVARSFRLSSATTVTMTSALSMLLVHACSGLAPASFRAAALASPLASSWWWTAQCPHRRNDYRTALGVASQIVTMLVERANHQKHHAVAARALRCLAADWLAAFDQPAWPGADVLLMQLCSLLAAVLTRRPPFDSAIAALQLLAVQLVGDVAARLRHEQRLVDAAWLSLLRPAVADAAEPPKQLACPCGSQDMATTWAIACDACGHWYHGACVNVPLPRIDGRPSRRGVVDVPELAWRCPPCHVRELVRQQQHQLVQQWQRCSEIAAEQRPVDVAADNQSDNDNACPDNHSDDDDNDDDDDLVLNSRRAALLTATLAGDGNNPLFVVQQLLLNALAAQYQGYDWVALSARQLYLSQWHEQAAVNEQSARRQRHFAERGNDDEAALERVDGYVLLQRWYAVQWAVSPTPLYSASLPQLSDDGQLRAVVRWFAASRPLMQSFDALLALVVQALDDGRTSHRAKAALALGQVIETDARLLLADQVQHAVAGLFNDDASSVREAVVTLVAQFLLDCPEHAERYLPLVSERVRDTSVQVRRRVVRFLMELCLKQPYHDRVPDLCRLLASRVHDDDSVRKLVLRTFTELWFPAKSDHAAAAAAAGQSAAVHANVVAQIVKVVGRGGYTAASQWLTALLATLLTQSARHVAQAGKICQGLICRFVGLLANSDAPQHAEQEAVVQALLLFGQVMIGLVAPHLETLLVYLTNDGAASPAALQALAELFQRALPELAHPRPDLLRSVERQLAALVCSADFSVLYPALRCLCVVSVCVGRSAALLGRLFAGFLQHLQQAPPGPDTPRALAVVGLCCRFAHRQLSLPPGQQRPADAAVPGYGPLLNVVYATLARYAGSPLPQLRYFSLQAVGSLCLEAPQFLVQHQAALQAALRPASSVQLKLCALQLLHDVMQLRDLSLVPCYGAGEQALRVESADENARRLLASADTGPGDGHALPDDHRFHDAAALGSVVHALLADCLLPLVFDTASDQVRLAAVGLLARAHALRLLNPLSFLGQLIASLSDPNDKVAHKAAALLSAVDAQHSTFLLTRLVEGVRQAHAFQLALGARRSPAGPPSHLQTVYNLVSANRAQRFDFVNAALQLFRDDNDDDLPLLRYAAEQVYFLALRYEEDPLHVVYRVGRLLELKLPGVLVGVKQLKKAERAKLAPTGRRSRVLDDNDDDDSDEDEKRRRAVLARQALLLALLLRLKAAVTAAHALSPSRCADYTPDAPLLKPLPGDATAALPSPFADVPLDCSTPDAQRDALAFFAALWKEERAAAADSAEPAEPLKRPAAVRTAKRQRPPARRDASDNEDDDDDEYRPARKPRRQAARTTRSSRRRRVASSSEGES